MPGSTIFSKACLSAAFAGLSFAAGLGALVAPNVAYAAPVSAELAPPAGAELQVNERTAAPDAQGRYMTVVRFREPSLAAYRGGVAGLEATNPASRGETRLNARTPQSQAYLAHLESLQSAHLARIAGEINRAVEPRFQYLHVLNAVALPLTLDEARKVQSLDFVRSVNLDEVYEVDTDVGPQFIGAPAFWNGATNSGLPNRGEGIIIGIIDSGFNHDHPSFADPSPDGYDHTNPLGVQLGACLTIPGLCNDKTIGAYDFHPSAPGPDDTTSGHGSHVASTAGGNPVTATINGLNVPISGVAPRANLINYRVCFPTCPQSSSVAAVNQGVADGVHVLNFSISGSDSPWSDIVDQAFLDASDAGIYVSASAGNAGPGASTVAHTGPWNATVANFFHDRVFGFRSDLTGPPGAPANTQDVTLVPGAAPINNTTITDAPIIQSPNFADGANDGCAAYPAGTFLQGGNPAIAVLHLDAGTSACASGVRRGNALAAGASGVIFVDDLFLNLGASGTSWAMTFADWNNFAAHIASNPAAATITITAPLGTRPGVGDIVNSGSSRGPSQNNVLAPDFGAPGTSILAAHLDSSGNFALLNGTSMSSPHSAGSGALMIAENPSWTPAQIRSALALTSAPDAMLKEDGITPANPFDRGSGRLNLNSAAIISATMDENGVNYAAADPNNGGDPRTLNQPNIIDNECIETCSFTRTITSVAAASVDYVASGVAPTGITIDITPNAFTLAPGATQVLTIDVTTDTDLAPPGIWTFGEIRLTPQSGVPPTNLLTNDFTDATFPPAGWAVFKLAGAGTTTWIRQTTSFSSAPAAARRIFGGSAEGNQIDWLVTPSIALGDNSQLSFNQRVQFPADYGKHSIQASTGSCDPNDGDFVEVAETGVNADGNVYAPRTIDLSAFDNQSVCLAFLYEGDFAATWFVDDVVVSSVPSAAQPTLRMPVVIQPQLADPVITVAPASVSETLDQGSNSTVETIAIGNDGGADLLWQISSDPLRGTLRPSRDTTPVAALSPENGSVGAGLRTDKVDAARSNDNGEGTLPGVVLSHSVSQTIVAPNGVSCGTGPNGFLRVYTPGDFGIVDPFDIDRVQFGIESLTAATDVTVNLYSFNPANPLTFANMTLEASATQNVAATTLALIDVPVEWTVPAGGTVVVEVRIAGTMFPGANASGQTAPSFIFAPSCGAPEPTNYASIGFPNSHLVLNIASDNDVDCGVNGNAAWATAAPTSGTVVADGSQNLSLTLNATGLDAGTYDTNLCLTSNDPAQPLAVVPVTLDVTAQPVIALSAASVSGSALPNGTDSTTFDIQNIGDVDLNWTTATAAPQSGAEGSGQLFVNGTIVNSPGTGPGGTDQSILQNTTLGMTTLGAGALSPTRLADDFTVTDAGGWQIDRMRFYAYQTNTSVSPFNGALVQIWNGPPNDPGSTVVFGDLTTNRFLATGDAGVFRISQTTVNTARPVFFIDAEVDVDLPPGTYWVDWTLTTTAGSAFAPPITINGQTVTGNALQFFTGAWAVLNDGGSLTQQGMPVEIYGLADSCSSPQAFPWLSVNPAGGTTTPDSASTVTVDFDATGLAFGTYEAKICVSSNDPSNPLVSLPVTFEVVEPTVDIAPATLADGAVGAAYSASVTGSGDGTTPPYSFSWSGDIPPGLSLDAAGDITGTPTAVGSYDVTVDATDSTDAGSGGPFSGSRNYTLVIAQGTQTIDFAPLADRLLNDSPFTVSATASSGLAVSFASLTAAVCTVAGDQVTLLQTGTCTLQATQGGDANWLAATPVDQSFEVIDPTIAIAPASLPAAIIDASYNVTLSASGPGTTAPYTFAVTAGALPPGLTLATDGTLSGTPTAEGDFTFTVTATDSTSAGSGGPFAGTRVYTLSVLEVFIFFDGFEDIVLRNEVSFDGTGPKRVLATRSRPTWGP